MSAQRGISQGAAEQLDRLAHELHEFLEDVEAHTIPCPAGRKFTSFASAAALSDSFNTLRPAVLSAMLAVYEPHLEPLAQIEPGVLMFQGVPFSVIGNDLAGLLLTLLTTVNWPTERHNEENERAPGRPLDHVRFRWEDVLQDEFLDTLRAAQKAVARVRGNASPRPPPGGEAADVGGRRTSAAPPKELATVEVREIGPKIVEVHAFAAGHGRVCAAIRGPSQVAFFTVVRSLSMSRVTEGLVPWDEVEAGWIRHHEFKGRQLKPSTFRDYSGRIRQTLSEQGLGHLWIHDREAGVRWKG